MNLALKIIFLLHFTHGFAAHAAKVGCADLFVQPSASSTITSSQKWQFPKQKFEYGTFETYYRNTVQAIPKGKRGLDKISKAAAEKGMTVVYDIDVAGMTKEEIMDLKKLLGQGTPIGKQKLHALKIVIVDELGLQTRLDGKPDPIYSQGVVLHVGVEPLLGSLFRSLDPSLNISMGYGDIQGRYDNKVREADDALKIDPKVMGESRSAESYLTLANSREVIEINRLRESIQNRLVKASESKQLRMWPKDLIRDIEKLILLFTEVTKTQQGEAFLKFAYESGTGDFEFMVTNFAKSPQKLAARVARQFLADFKTVREEARQILRREKMLHKDLADQIPQLLNFLDPNFQSFLREQDQGFTNFLNALLIKPENILVQSKVGVAMLPSQNIAEYRVHFLDGEVVQVIPRNGYDFIPEYEAKAAAKIKEFFKKAPKEFRYLIGGADVMLAPDGSAKVIEFNYGAASSFMDAINYPFLGNEFVMTIAQGFRRNVAEQNTQLLAEFESLIEKSLTTTEVRPLIERLRKCYKCSWGEDATLEKYSLKEISDDEALYWVGRRFAQRAFDISRSQATQAERLAKIDRVQKVFENVYAGLTKEQQTTADMKEIKEAVVLSLQRLRTGLK